MHIPVKKSWLGDSVIVMGFEPTTHQSGATTLHRSATQAHTYNKQTKMYFTLLNFKVSSIKQLTIINLPNASTS